MASKAMFASFTESTDVEEAGCGEWGLGTRYTPPFFNAPLIVSILQSFICQVHLLSLCNVLSPLFEVHSVPPASCPRC